MYRICDQALSILGDIKVQKIRELLLKFWHFFLQKQKKCGNHGNKMANEKTRCQLLVLCDYTLSEKV